MQFVAASKLRRAQDATLAARPYRDQLDEVLADLAAVLAATSTRCSAAAKEASASSSWSRATAAWPGALNSNTVRFASREIVEHTGRPRAS